MELYITQGIAVIALLLALLGVVSAFHVENKDRKLKTFSMFFKISFELAVFSAAIKILLT